MIVASTGTDATDAVDNKDLETFRERIMELAAQKESESTDPLHQCRVILDDHGGTLSTIDLIISSRTELGAIVAYAESLKSRGLENVTTPEGCYVYSYRYIWDGFTDEEFEEYMMSMADDAFNDNDEIHFYEMGEPQVYHAPQLDATKSSNKKL